MHYQGQIVGLFEVEPGIFNLRFDDQHQALNKLSRQALQELEQALDQLPDNRSLQGLLVSSGKDSFIAGADIAEFSQVFSLAETEIGQLLAQMNALLNRLEDLPCPTVCAINGVALGGGFELSLCTDFRVLADDARVGLPEVRLGLYPAWGGTVRLPRLIGVDNANEWICGGEEKTAQTALQYGAVDAVVAGDTLLSAALDLLKRTIAGEFDYRSIRQRKTAPVSLSQTELLMAYESARGLVAKKAGPHYPAPMAALKSMQKQVSLERERAQAIEQKGFIPLAKSEVSQALIGLFMKEHLLKKLTARYVTETEPVTQAAVLGAGIMGGGIACQSALKGIPVLLRDISHEALQRGLQAADKRLQQRVERGRMSPGQMVLTLNQITPTLGFAGFKQVDLAVEAVVEDLPLKRSVLADAERRLPDTAILTSNTSTLSIGLLAEALQRPENFCGLHFFNPVHRMPLVEVIRGPQTSDSCISRTVNYALAIGKTPIVVNDGPGFLVNRILMAYFLGFESLLRDGVDFSHIDRVMQAYGWPMGPAALLDAVGLDTASHAAGIMATGFPQRMQLQGSAIETLYRAGRLGQKNGVGFYQYRPDRKGRVKPLPDPAVNQLLALSPGDQAEIPDTDIIERMMIPLCLETIRCLEDGIVATPVEADMALIMGLGFPPFRGGALYSVDQQSLSQFCERADRLAAHGALYQPTDKLRQMAASGNRFFQRDGGRS